MKPQTSDAPRSAMHAAGIESRLYRLVIRYFVLHDENPTPYRTAAEALLALRHRQTERRQA